MKRISTSTFIFQPVCQPTPEVRRRKREDKNETSVVTFVQVVPNTVQPDTCSNGE